MHKNICIYGGSFDPITYAHEMVLDKISNLNWIHEIWVVICRCRNDKTLTEFHHRHNMFTIIINNSSKIIKSKIFLKDLESHSEMTPTYDLLKTQKELHPNYTFYFGLGSDLICDIFSWDEGEKLVLENAFIIIERGHFKIDESILKKFPKYYLINIPKLSFINFISSSEARKFLTKENDINDIKKYIHPLTIDYIIKYNLYDFN
ncbi:nicotinate mononucleotide adenylyltransferase [Plasmodium reichenowi]|uniref:Nicotinate mononucleotide adenylyltransferase n=1 Tax=Plasmodium reichenowi TaxID=5854 RepID=A0A060S2V0_PLARE|nr:nicotinate-nucleotide adenylyltransferase, putative [Plasmodium reichenowi]KYN94717.1 nicotinate-nucleotide adenylyltransferase, putative [Plasmodium reichenowi]CDO66070.1 nicotinate-nucleotide adenylyltransferase, putative [Plasmodium reichenowi]SOV81915.1 nicotinate mononucleotide adenylyltransferase [Plasmodium reichenowi]